MNAFLFAGETSGDLHGSKLIQALRADYKTLFGVGGPLMREQGLDLLLPMEEFQVMGFSDVLFALPRLWKHFHTIVRTIIERQPVDVILIDYPGFNLRLAKALRKKGYKGKITQYISPSVWAHGKKRIDHMSRHLDLLLVIYPFESACFSHTKLRTVYMGNPIAEAVQSHVYEEDWRQSANIPLNQPLIALFPGSRKGEIERHLPLMVEMMTQLKQQFPDVCFVCPLANESLRPLFESYSDIHLIPFSLRYELMRDCHLALAKSGTVTLELCLHHKPTLVIYTLTTLNYLIARFILRVNLPHYCIVNILGNKGIYPEYIGRTLPKDQILTDLIDLYQNQGRRERIQKECREVQAGLGSTQYSHVAVEAIRSLKHDF